MRNSRTESSGGRNDDGECITVGIVCPVQQLDIHVRPGAIDGRVQGDRAARSRLHIVIEIVAETSKLSRNGARSERNQRSDIPLIQRKLRNYRRIQPVTDRWFFRL
jgi:hypothetical protein